MIVSLLQQDVGDTREKKKITTGIRARAFARRIRKETRRDFLSFSFSR